MKYYLSRDYKVRTINSAGSKARMDIECIMDNMGYCRIGTRNSISRTRLSHFISTLVNFISAMIKVRRGDILVLQYPTKYYNAICFLSHLLGVYVVTFVHDLYCFRQKRNSIACEISLMNMSDAIIGCNDVVCKWLCDNGYVGYNKKTIIESIGVFDFLSDSESSCKSKSWPMKKIVYAGQLSIRKNKFLCDFSSNISDYTIDIYGSGLEKLPIANPNKFNVMGFMHYDNLISCADGDFGLVWDGNSLDACDGDWGEYLMINTPHKVSLYIRAGLPVLIWRKAAMSKFVEENNIGVCIESLHEISDIYNNMIRGEYENICNNVSRVSKLMSEGYFFSKALSKVVESLEEKIPLCQI